MKRFVVDPQDVGALLALTGLGVGSTVVQGVGWGLIVVSALVLVYLVLPDQRPGGPTP